MIKIEMYLKLLFQNRKIDLIKKEITKRLKEFQIAQNHLEKNKIEEN